MIKGAFQGFAKQNYTMLDNLKLGYGGTKEEMQRLIQDANTYAKSIGKASDLSIDSFSDVVTAIELVQKKQGIAGWPKLFDYAYQATPLSVTIRDSEQPRLFLCLERFDCIW